MEPYIACPVRSKNPAWYVYKEMNCASSWNRECRQLTKDGDPHCGAELVCMNTCAMAEQMLARAEEMEANNA